jgi:hypothetical protein
MQSIGLKEWALVCEALGSGRERVIIRKGGIAKERDYRGNVTVTSLEQASVPASQT